MGKPPLDGVLGGAADGVVLGTIGGGGVRDALFRLSQYLLGGSPRGIAIVPQALVSFAAVLECAGPLLDRLCRGLLSQQSRCPR